MKLRPPPLGVCAGLLVAVALDSSMPVAAERATRRPTLDTLFNRLDRNGDGKLTKEEAGLLHAARFDEWDANGDGVVEKAEMRGSLARKVIGGNARPRAAATSPAGQPREDNPFEVAGEFEPANRLDELLLAALAEKGVAPANLCSDSVFLRRVYLDLIGTLPTPEEWLQFVYTDTSPQKRQALVEELLTRKEFADYWATKWADVLRVKAEFPINLWPNAVQAYHRWIHDAMATNMPYDEFARELLTSSGSNFRVPPVNFYRAIQGKEPATIAAAVALTFMGTRFDAWPEERRQGMTAFFTRVGYKGTAEWKEEIVYLDPEATGPLDAVFPDGTPVHIEADQDPRQVFADWLIRPENPWFSRALVNRVWSWLFGRGLVHEADDLRPDNPPVHPEILDYLARDFADNHYDLRHLLRTLVNSRTYQQSSIPQAEPAEADRLFAHYPVRRLDAEVLIDALCWLFADGESYSSQIPEPFTWIPADHRTMELADGSITSQFLELFGRPSRDTGLESDRNNELREKQRLHLLNSSDVQRRLERSLRFKGCVAWAKGDLNKLIDALYVNILSREPTNDEQTAARAYFDKGLVNTTQGWQDLAWALINSKEFLYRH